VKTYLKILAALVSVAVLFLVVSFVVFLRDESLRCDTITLDGNIVPETFVAVRECLVRSFAPKKTFVVKHSGGGDGATAMALGILIHRHRWDVEVVDICASSCANWIFPAGRTKYLDRDSLLLFHGGPYQENMFEMGKALERKLTAKGVSTESVTVGQVNKEGTITFTLGKSKALAEVLEFLSWREGMNADELVSKMRSTSDQLYQELGVNPLVSAYGQIGAYEPIYKSYKYGGFTYRLDSLSRLGIGNVELKDGEWNPERNPAYQDVYEVTYP